MRTIIFVVCLGWLLSAGLRVSAQDADRWEREAKAAVEANIRSFNARDRQGYWAAYNYPLIMVETDGRVSIRAATPQDAQAMIQKGQPGFAALQEEGWDHSTLDVAEAVHVSADKVHFKIVFTRHRKDGSAYRSIPALWIVTRRNGHWGIQVQSGLPDLPTPILR